ncbi:MAG TPA: hypothetical protein VF897_06845, partial [Roseiflexaceae bacterium]
MAGSIPSAHDSILRFVDADGAERAVVIDSPEWHVWLADSGHSRFAFTCRAGSFTARKERKQRGAWYWVAYRRAQGKIHKAYLGKPADLTLARLQSVAALLAERSAPRDDAPARDAGIQPQAANTAWPGGTATLLLTKLYVPPIRPNLVARRRLVEHLHAGARGRLTLLSAPAGFGKTTLLAEWIASLGAGDWRLEAGNALQASSLQPPASRVAWVSLDEGDADPVRFWSYVVAALDRLFPGLGAGALAALQSPQPPPIEAVLTPLLNALAALPGDVALILDDYHVIGTHAIHQALTFLIEHLPPQLHLVIATRSDPPLPLTRLRARGELVEVRTTDLRFSAVEAAAFLQEAMGLPLSAADVAALETRTEGWIAGLQLAALAMRDRTDLAGFITAFTGSNRFVMDYLAAEVIERLPPQLQTFVLQTSILDRLCGPLCDAILGDRREARGDRAMRSATDPIAYRPLPLASQHVLEQLERANLFIVPLDDERTWYRYHHL